MVEVVLQWMPLVEATLLWRHLVEALQQWMLLVEVLWRRKPLVEPMQPWRLSEEVMPRPNYLALEAGQLSLKGLEALR